MLDVAALAECVTDELSKQFAVCKYERYVFAGWTQDDGELRTKSSTLLLGQITLEHIPAVAAEYDGGAANELNRVTLFNVVSCEDAAAGVYSVDATNLGRLESWPSERYISSRARTNPLAYASCSAVTDVGKRNWVGVGVMAADVTLRQLPDGVFIGESSSSNIKSDSDTERLRWSPVKFRSKFIALRLSHDIIVLALTASVSI